jgi:hypothetical protein
MKMKFVAIEHFSRSTQSHAVLRLLSVTETLHYVLIAQEIKHLVGRQNLVFLAVIGDNASKDIVAFGKRATSTALRDARALLSCDRGRIVGLLGEPS